MTTKIKILFFLLFFSAQHLAGQEPNAAQGSFENAVYGGFHYTTFRLDGEKLVPLARPFVGLSTAKIFTDQLRLKGMFAYSSKASKINGNYRYSQSGIELAVIPQFKWDDLLFNAGLNYDFVINGSVKAVGSSEGNRTDRFNGKTVPSLLQAVVGTELKVANNLNLGFNFYVPIGANRSANFQLAMSYRIGNRGAKEETIRRIKRRRAIKQIKQLKDGALLVRLRTSVYKIAAMRKLGFDRLADETKKEQRAHNLKLVQAFNAYYRFSEVRFFYSDQSQQVRDRNFEGIFLNDQLEIDSNIVLRNSKNVFTAEFADLERDTTKYFSHYEMVQTGNFQQQRVERYYGDSRNSFMALVVKDDQFNQLDRPFPYYSRAAFKLLEEEPSRKILLFPILLFSPKNYGECVEGLEFKLNRYFQRVRDK